MGYNMFGSYNGVDSESKWRLLLENTPNLMIVVDEHHTVLFINQVVPGMDVDVVQGNSIYDFVDPRFHNVSRCAIDQVFMNGETRGFVTQGVGNWGKTTWYDVQLRSVRSAGKVVAVSMMATDITQHKKKTEELEEYTMELEEQIEDMTSILENYRRGVTGLPTT
jgi:PAS domain S-box-containing protein